MFASDEKPVGPAADSSCAPFPVVQSVYASFETDFCSQFTGIDGVRTTRSWAAPHRFSRFVPL
jgi:hypothetical protein